MKVKYLIIVQFILILLLISSTIYFYFSYQNKNNENTNLINKTKTLEQSLNNAEAKVEKESQYRKQVKPLKLTTSRDTVIDTDKYVYIARGGYIKNLEQKNKTVYENKTAGTLTFEIKQNRNSSKKVPDVCDDYLSELMAGYSREVAGRVLNVIEAGYYSGCEIVIINSKTISNNVTINTNNYKYVWYEGDQEEDNLYTYYYNEVDLLIDKNKAYGGTPPSPESIVKSYKPVTEDENVPYSLYLK